MRSVVAHFGGGGFQFPRAEWDLLPVPEKFLGIVGQEPSDFKSNWLHVDIFQFCFTHLRYIVWIPLSHCPGNFWAYRVGQD